MYKITRSDFWKIFFRSFFIQSGWNYKGMISLGFTFAMEPVAKRLYKNEPEKYNRFLGRSLGFFNAHPYFSAYALGAMARLEEKIAAGEVGPEQSDAFKNALIGPLGALGDQLFWAVIKPAVFALGVAAFFIIDDIYNRIIILSMMFLLYNGPHFYIRYMGLKQGYEQGYGVCHILKAERFKWLKWGYGLMGAVSVGLVAGIYMSSLEIGDYWAGGLFIASIFIAGFFKAQKSKTYWAMILPLLFSVIIGILSRIL